MQHTMPAGSLRAGIAVSAAALRSRFGNGVMRSDMQVWTCIPAFGDGIFARSFHPRLASASACEARLHESRSQAVGRVASIRDAARGRKKFAQFLRKSGCAMPDRAAGRRRFVNTKTVSERVLRHLQRASMRNCTSRDAQMLREKNAFI
jgi:hypothetical protein